MMWKLAKAASLAMIASAVGCGAAAPSVEAPSPLRPIVPVEEYHVEQLTYDNFDSWVNESDLPVVVDFWRERCGACVEVKPVFSKVCADMQGRVYCASYDTAQDRQMPDRIPARYDVRYVPAFRFYCNGAEQEERRFSGSRDESELRSEIEDFLEECATQSTLSGR